jgi:hypothetical protein
MVLLVFAPRGRVNSPSRQPTSAPAASDFAHDKILKSLRAAGRFGWNVPTEFEQARARIAVIERFDQSAV